MSKTWWGWDVSLPPGTLVAGYPSSPLDSLRVSSRGYLPPHNMIVKALFPLLHCYLETAFILLLLKFCNQLLEEQKFSGHSPSFPARGLAHARTGTCAIHRSIWEAVFFCSSFSLSARSAGQKMPLSPASNLQSLNLVFNCGWTNLPQQWCCLVLPQYL